jgi:hypothetical protein
VAFRLHFFEQSLHAADLLGYRIQLCEFAVGELPPAGVGSGSVLKSEEKCANFIEGESSLPRSLYH